MPLTDLFVSYGAALAPAGFHKITLSDGGQAELNRGLGTSSSFLWCHESPTRGQPIVELKIVDREETDADYCPEGFEKIPRNMLVGSDQFAFIFIRRSCDVDPIGEIRLLYGNESQPDKGFTRLLPPVFCDESGAKSISLTFSTVSKDAPVKWSAANLAPGDKCDIQDSEKRWHLGEVMSSGTTKTSVRVALVVAPVPRNLTLPRSSPRLAAPGTQSSGTRATSAQQGTACEDMTKECLEALELKMQRLYPDVRGEDEGEGDDSSLWQEVVEIVETALSSSHLPPLVPAVNTFLRAVLSLLVRVAQGRKGLREAQLRLLEKLLFLDEKFSWYYTHYGAGVVVEDAFLDLHRDYLLSGPVAVTDMSKSCSTGGQKSAWGAITSTISSHFKSTSTNLDNDRAVNLLGLKLLVTNVNHFAAVGGLDALLEIISGANISQVQQILSLIKILSQKLIRKAYLETFLPKLQECVCLRLLTLDDREYRDTLTKDPSKDFVVLVWRDLEHMIRRVFKEIAFFEIYERFSLNYAEKLISCQMLNLKIKGLNVLNDVIDKTVRKESTVKKPMYSISQSVSPTNEPSWLTSSFLAEWLQERDLLGLLLGNSASSRKKSSAHTHDEVLKRVQTVLLFLAKRQGGCSDAHVALLWQQAGGRDGPDSSAVLATSRVAHALLSALVPYISPAMVTLITGEIKSWQEEPSCAPSSSGAEYCQLNVSLVKSMLEHGLTANTPKGPSVRPSDTVTSIDSSSADCTEESKAESTSTGKDVQLLGLDILWNFLIVNRGDDDASSPGADGGGASARQLFTATQLAAADALATVLSKPHTRAELNAFLKKCVDHIDAFPSPPSSPDQVPSSAAVAAHEDVSMGSILLLKRVVEMQAPPRPAAQAYVSYYHTPASAHKKTTGQELSRALIIKSCENKHDLLRVMIDYIGKCIHWKSVSSLCSSEYKVYTQSLQVCMELLQVVLNNSELELTVPQVTGLWGGFSSGTADDMNMFFKWLHSSCPVEAPGAVTASNYSAARAPAAAAAVASSSVKKDTSCCMTEEALVHVFLGLFGSQYDMSCLSEIGFEALEKIFRYVNGKEKSLLYSSNKSNFQVAAPVLVGFDVLMKVYVCSQDMKIVDLMSKLLISLQVKLTPTLDRRAVWISFTTKCLEMLQELSLQSSSIGLEGTGQQGIRQIGRVLLLLQHFFDGIYKCNIPVPASTTSLTYTPIKPDEKPPIVPLRVTVFWKREGIRINNNAVYVFKKGTVSVGSLRVRLAADLKVASPNLIRLVNSMRVTLTDTHDHMLLESIGVTSFVDMTILLKPEADTEKFKLTAPAAIMADDPDSDQMAPRKLVADDSSNLSLLFKLLSLPNSYSLDNGIDSGNSGTSLSKHELYEISNYAWELLALLPTNPGMLQEVETLGGVLLLDPPLPTPPHDSKQAATRGDLDEGTVKQSSIVIDERDVDWSHVLSTEGLLRQHYKLKIVHDIIAPFLQQSLDGQLIAKDDVQRASEWSETFIDKGGVDCLRELVMKTDVAEIFEGNLFKQCLSLRIELLSIFLKQRPSLLDSSNSNAAKGCSDAADDVLLVTKLVHFLHSVILGPPSDDDTDIGCFDEDRVSLLEDERPVLKRIRSASQGSLDSHPPPSFSSPASAGSCSVQMKKLERRRSREARFEKYFSTQTQNTSAGKASGVQEERVLTAGSDDDSEAIMLSQQQDGDVALVDNIMAVLSFILEERPLAVISVVHDMKYQNIWEDALFVSLLQSPSAELREAICAGVLTLCETGEQAAAAAQVQIQDDQSLPNLTQFFLTNLLILLPHSSLDMVFCSEFFKLLSKLLAIPNILAIEDVSFPTSQGDGDGEAAHAVAVVPTLLKVSTTTSELTIGTEACVDIRQLSVSLAHMLVSHAPMEKSEEDDDNYLQGLLLVFTSFLSALFLNGSKNISQSVMFDLGISRHLMLELFHNCLFSKKCVFIDGASESQTDVDSAGAGYPKCKSSVSRKHAFDLLDILSTESNNCALLLKLLRPHHSIETSALNQQDPVGDGDSSYHASKSLTKYRHAVTVPKSTSGFCGILNPSCVCYLNSTLQQLFHVTSFRQGVLEATTETQLGSAGAKDDMMLQLQLLFATLQESDQAFADPKPFCYSFKDWDGRPTNVSVQQDASEFLAKFFQQVENAVMGSKSEKVLKDTFGGYLSNELLATATDGSPRRSERPEPFYVLSVPVGRGSGGGNHCLTDALSSFIRGEQVDYTWETEVKTAAAAVAGEEGGDDDVESKGRKATPATTIVKEALPTTKRTTIKQLPNHLIVHLKRFDFNFETMQQIKINDRFDFPHELDMFPFTVLGRQEQEMSEGKTSEGDASTSALLPGSETVAEAKAEKEEGLTKEECQYKLAGVVVHIGTAHSGHYYSLVKNRSPSSSSTADTWFELNDSFVSDFDVDDLESETFGGVDVGKASPQVGSAAAIHAAKDKLCAKNAFMLVYDRVKPPQVTEIETRLTTAATSTVVPPSILTTIQRENQSFWNTKSIFDPMYYDFLTDSVLPGAARVLEAAGASRIATDDIYSMLELIITIVFGTFSQAQMQVHVQKWMLWFVDRMRRQPNLACWLLQLVGCSTGTRSDKHQWLCALLLDSEDQEIRLCGRRIISVALVIVSSDAQFSGPADPSSQADRVCDEGCDDVAPVSLSEGEGLCLQVVDYLVRSLLRGAQLQWRRVHAFFTPVSVLANSSAACRAVMMSRDYLAALLSFFLCQDTPYPELVGGEEPGTHKSRSMCEGNATADCSSLLVAIVALLRAKTKGESDIFVESDGKQSESESTIEGDASGSLEKSSAVDESHAVSPKSLEMLSLPVFMYRLLKTLDVPEHKPQVLQILDFVLKDSKKLTESCVQIILSAMKKEDGVGLKAPLRCAMLLCRIRDSITGWRVSFVLQQVIVEIKTNIQYVQAADVSITMFLRICKQSHSAAEWLRLNYHARLTWIEGYLLSRKGAMIPPKGVAWKPIKTASAASASAVDKSVQGAAAVAAAVKLQTELNLLLLKRLMIKHKDAPVGVGVPPMTKFSHTSIQSGGYDSDDDPSDLVGLKLQVQWKGSFYPGRVESFDKRTSQHMVHYDDGDKAACLLKAKVWSLLD